MIELIKYIRKHMPFIWICLEFINSLLVKIRFGKKINTSINRILAQYSKGYQLKEITDSDIQNLAVFFSRQPEGFDKYFKPHGFDEVSIRKTKNREYIKMFSVNDNNQIIGYFFIRFFANGKAFRGKIVDINYRGKGIAKMMGACATDIAFMSGFRLMGTISKNNIASIQSSKSVNKIHIIKELDDNYIYVEYLPKE